MGARTICTSSPSDIRAGVAEAHPEDGESVHDRAFARAGGRVPSRRPRAAIQIPALLASRSHALVKTAVPETVQTAARGALAVGLPRVDPSPALVLEHAVVLEALATHMEGDDEEPGEPEAARDLTLATPAPSAERASRPRARSSGSLGRFDTRRDRRRLGQRGDRQRREGQ
jgi:hypothetical protein